MSRDDDDDSTHHPRHRFKFDPAFFMYLNPRVVAHNDITVENAEAYYADHIADSLYGDPALLPISFNETIYIVDHKDNADVSNVNKDIIEEYSQDECCRHGGDFIDNISMPMKIEAKNTFRVAVPKDREISERMLNVGDQVKIRKGQCDIAYAFVTAIDRFDYTIEVTNRYYDFLPESQHHHHHHRDCYFLFGIRVVDIRRIAIINYMRRSHDVGGTHKVDSEFNAELYKVLYPDARSLTCMASYMDYVSRHERGDHRIRSVGDIAKTLDLKISSPVTFMGVEVKEISLNPWSKPCDHGSLITERAIKCYVDEKSVFSTAHTEFKGGVTFDRAVTFESHKTVFPKGLETIAIGIGRINRDNDDNNDNHGEHHGHHDNHGEHRGHHDNHGDNHTRNPFDCGFDDMPIVPRLSLSLECQERLQQPIQESNQTRQIRHQTHQTRQIRQIYKIDNSHHPCASIGIGSCIGGVENEIDDWRNDQRIAEIIAKLDISRDVLDSCSSVADFMLSIIARII